MTWVCVVAVVEALLTGSPGAVDVPGTLIPDPNWPIKTRFISFSNPFPGQTAVRVLLTSLHNVDPPYTGAVSVPFTAFEGRHVWVGPPASYRESSDFPVEFMASFTQCTPYYHEWGTVGLLHVTGPQIVPSSNYHVEALHASCQGNEHAPECQPGGANVSSQLEVRTSRWGDVGEPRNPPSPTVQPDATDIAIEITKFRRPPDDPPNSSWPVRRATPGVRSPRRC